MAPVHKCVTNLLLDTPSEKDDFGSHARVAQAIFDLIDSETSNKKTPISGVRCIGLEGRWGSGKSTIIKLLRKMFSSCDKPTSTDKTALFVFDAWAHQGDPLRRTFLQEIIDSLQEWIDDKITINSNGQNFRRDWQEYRKKLGWVEKITDVTNYPSITFGARLYC